MAILHLLTTMAIHAIVLGKRRRDEKMAAKTEVSPSRKDEAARAGEVARLATRVVPLAEAKRQLSELCSRAGYGRDSFVLTKRGKPLAAIVSVADLERYRALEDEEASRLLERAIATSRGVVKVTSA